MFTNFSIQRSIQFGFLSVNILAESEGASVKLTNNDTAMAKAMVRPKLLKNLPTNPLRNATGTNTASSESVVAMTANPISLVPLIAASKGLSFLSWICLKMFSTTMIASSMTIPTAKARATRLIEFNVTLATHMTPKLAIMEVGMASAEIKVARPFPKKNSTIKAAKMEPKTKCSFTAPVLVRMINELSRTISILYPAGSVLRISSRRSFTASTTAMVFSPDCLRIDNVTVGWPLRRATVSKSSEPSSTRPTSLRRTSPPSRSLTTRRPISSTLCALPWTRSPAS